MVDSGTPDEVVTLIRQRGGAFGQIDSEHALDQQHHGCALVVCSPLGAFVARWVNAPLDFDILARSHALGWVDESAQEPSPGLLAVLGGIPVIPAGAHDRTSHSIAGMST